MRPYGPRCSIRELKKGSSAELADASRSVEDQARATAYDIKPD
jgi:hypothetical protein